MPDAKPLRTFAGIALTLLLASSAAVSAFAGETAVMTSRVISAFKVGSPETRFGALEFVGGLELSSTTSLFGAVSSIRFRPDGRNFIAVLDTGHWMTGTVERDAEGRLSDMSDLTITSMIDKDGQDETVKWNMDAEGMTIRGDDILVSFERRHRIDIYPLSGFETSGPKKSIPFLIPKNELRANGGFEMIAASPAESPLMGSTVIIAEKSVDKKGNLFAAVVDGPAKGLFSVRRHDSFDVTDGAFLPNGDLLILERRFNWATGIAMRIRRLKGADIVPGAVVDGDILITADFNYQIDNMEGLDVITGEDGATHIILTSDDNHSILQRNVMLEFRLVE
ncbi:MAG: hypothetical protein BGN83_04280 [Rhizobium sp. 63-7]|nr:MAG: hypothetical protein BGN83_04280 [Rhizobium sp. 63-7]